MPVDGRIDLSFFKVGKDAKFNILISISNIDP